MIDKKTYYLWGLFPPEETEYLNFLKDKVQSKLISPNFDLHITLSGPYVKIGKTFIRFYSHFFKLRKHFFTPFIYVLNFFIKP